MTSLDPRAGSVSPATSLFVIVPGAAQPPAPRAPREAARLADVLYAPPPAARPRRAEFLQFSPPVIGEEEIAEVVDTLRSQWLSTGPKTKRFEQEFAEYLGAPGALALNSCTAGLHLVLDGAWANTDVFWWPAFGVSFGHDRLPELDRGALSVAMELVGVAALVYAWNRFDLRNPAARDRFLRTGQLSR